MDTEIDSRYGKLFNSPVQRVLKHLNIINGKDNSFVNIKLYKKVVGGGVWVEQTPKPSRLHKRTFLCNAIH